MMSLSTSAIAARPASLRLSSGTNRLVPAAFRSQRRSQAFVVNANYNRNFKTRETEAKIDNNTPDADELNAKLQGYLEGVQQKWEETDEKPAVVAIALVSFIAIWGLSGVVDRLDKLPLVGGLLELVGLLVTGWFIYRYLAFAPDRKELKKNVDTFYNKVTGKKKSL